MRRGLHKVDKSMYYLCLCWVIANRNDLFVFDWIKLYELRQYESMNTPSQ